MVKETVPAAKTSSQRNCLNGVRLFGVDISSELTPLRKSLSLGNLDSLLTNGNGDTITAVEDSGYHSDSQIQIRSKKDKSEKKKGKLWTEEEHRSFLIGLREHGKGNWRGIAKRYVTTRTPTQVASHAQKYFNRLNANDKRKRRASLFDISLDEQKDEEKKSPQVTEDASTSSSTKPKEISNRFQNLSMDYIPIYQTGPPYYSFPTPLMFYPMCYANPEPIRFINHPSGIPIPRHIPTGMTQSQSNEASQMIKDSLQLQIALPSPPPSSSTSYGATYLMAPPPT